MGSTKPAVSFDEIINRDRQRRENETLAQEIFGRNKHANELARNANRRAAQPPSLASRTGIAKRSPSSTNIKPPKNNPFTTPKPPSRPSSAAAQIARTNRMASAVNDSAQANIQPPRAVTGLSIKGTAGPFVVHASNFAPGTTAADIESALQSVATDSSGASGMASCRILTNNPTVMAEMVFNEKHIADSIIATFNNQKADGRILHVFMHRSGPSAVAPPKRKSELIPVPEPKPIPEDSNGTIAAPPEEDVEMGDDSTAAYAHSRQVADQDRRDQESRRAEPDIQDGRYGFDNNNINNSSSNDGRADELPPREDPPRSTRPPEDRDGRDDRRYDNHGSSSGGSSYPRRGDDYRRDDRYGSYGRGPPPGPPRDHFGNGIRGGRGYGPSNGDRGDRYGRMYSDDVMRRDGPRIPRGGRGGGYR